MMMIGQGIASDKCATWIKPRQFGMKNTIEDYYDLIETLHAEAKEGNQRTWT